MLKRLEKYDGEDAFHEYMHNAALRYLGYEKQRNTPIHDTTTADLMALSARHIRLSGLKASLAL